MSSRRRRIQSSLGNVNFTSNGPEKDEVIVEDANTEDVDVDAVGDVDLNDPYGRLSATNNKKNVAEKKMPDVLNRKKEERAPKSVISRYEVLAGIARITKDIKIENTVFSIRSLKGREQREVLMAVSSSNVNNGIEEMYKVRAYTLAMSLYKIDGRPIEEVLQTDDLDQIANIIDDWEESLSNHLFSEYTNMVNNHNKNISSDLGNTAEEIVENVKK